MLDNIFGAIPDDQILNPEPPYGIRFNCQSGQLALSETEFLGTEAEISIIKVARFFGSLGKTQNTEWLQLFYVAAPGTTIIPQNVVCVSYLKTRSLSAFNAKVIKLLSNKVNPATGIFKVGFQAHSNDKGNYFSVTFEWRPRTEEEEGQLEMIADFMASDPVLIDTRVSTSLVCLEGMSKEEKESLLLSAAA